MIKQHIQFIRFVFKQQGSTDQSVVSPPPIALWPWRDSSWFAPFALQCTCLDTVRVYEYMILWFYEHLVIDSLLFSWAQLSWGAAKLIFHSLCWRPCLQWQYSILFRVSRSLTNHKREEPCRTRVNQSGPRHQVSAPITGISRSHRVTQPPWQIVRGKVSGKHVHPVGAAAGTSSTHVQTKSTQTNTKLDEPTQTLHMNRPCSAETCCWNTSGCFGHLGPMIPLWYLVKAIKYEHETTQKESRLQSEFVSNMISVHSARGSNDSEERRFFNDDFHTIALCPTTHISSVSD